MKLAHIYLAEGFEEIEAVTVMDLLRRAGMTVVSVSLTESLTVLGAHQILVTADAVSKDVRDLPDVLILPGGQPGTKNLAKDTELRKRILAQAERGGYLAAICAAPTVFAELGLIKGKKVTSFPGRWEEMAKSGGEVLEATKTVEDSKIITSQGVGTAIDFALRIVRELVTEAAGKALAKKIVYDF
jgi:protein deglycase